MSNCKNEASENEKRNEKKLKYYWKGKPVSEKFFLLRQKQQQAGQELRTVYVTKNNYKLPEETEEKIKKTKKFCFYK